MSDDAPKTIWALADRRRYWQDSPPQEGQHEWHWQEYTLTKSIPDAAAIRNTALREAMQIAEEWFGTPDADDIARILHGKIEDLIDTPIPD